MLLSGRAAGFALAAAGRSSFSTTATRYPLYYELISHRPARRSRPSSLAAAGADSADDSDSGMERSQRRYYRKRRRRVYGEFDTAAGGGAGDAAGDTVELTPEVVDFPRLHAREEELYFYDAFAMPWEKGKHYRMVHQLEKKYFPKQSLDNAFVPVEASDEKGLVFFEDRENELGKEKDAVKKNIEEFMKAPQKMGKEVVTTRNAGLVKAAEEEEKERGVEPWVLSKKTELPPRWDGPTGAVVLIDKPKGWTSFTVCGKLRRLVKVQKVGHAGTLDPMATGLLIVCVGKATKLADRYQGMVKGYSGIFRLGEATSTWDADSPVTQREPWEHIKDESIRKTAASFLGEIWQVPPMFSAIKLGGERMYEKARRGEMVELSPRRISIYQFDIERSLQDRQNLVFRVTCSKGTYIRSLCADFGKALGSCAHLAALRRDSIGEFTVNDAWSFDELQEEITKGYL